MAITDISIPLQYIKSGTLASRPDGQFDGQIFYATDTDASFVWDGTDWQDSSVSLDNVNKLIGLNALNILDITAQANLTAGINANFERDTYSDATGYLNTIDTNNSTGAFLENIYTNFGLEQTVNNTYSTSEGNDPRYLVGNFPFSNKKITSIKFTTGGATYPEIYLTFTYSDTTTQTVNGDGANITLNAPLNKLVTNVKIEMLSHKNGTTTSITKIEFFSTDNAENKLVQTNAQSVEAGFTKFMIVANEETSGTGSVTYDITFDGTNYQEDLTSFTEYTINDAGTSLILKQKLNPGASNGTASAYNWGVLLW